ncbi:MAG: protein phosphatase 2C domain-containing protein [Pseudonocardiaceae bacterium]
MDVTFAHAAGSRHHHDEDWIATSPEAVVLLDGLSTPEGLQTGCRHGTPWYVRRLGTQLLGLLATHPDATLREALACVIQTVAHRHADTCDLSHPGMPSATVALLRAGPSDVQCLVLSDALIVLDTSEGIEVLTDPTVTQLAAEQRRAVLRERIGTPGHTLAKQAMVVEQQRHRNVGGGHWVAAADPDAATHAVTRTVARHTIRRAAVLSDGAAVLVDYGLADWSDILDTLQHAGPAELIARIRTAEAGDPLGQRWPRYKIGDDATAALCLFPPHRPTS